MNVLKIIGGLFNLAVWRIICNLPNLNNAISGLKLLCSLTAIAFRPIKVMPTPIFDGFAKYLTHQLFCIYGTTNIYTQLSLRYHEYLFD